MSIKLLKKIIKQQKVNTNIFILKSYDLTLKQRIKIMLINNNLSIKNQITSWLKTSCQYNKYEILQSKANQRNGIYTSIKILV